MNMKIPGKRIKVIRWIEGNLCALRAEVDAVIPDAEPSEPCFELESIRLLDHLQELADAGKIEELEKHGTVYLRKSA